MNTLADKVHKQGMPHSDMHCITWPHNTMIGAAILFLGHHSYGLNYSEPIIQYFLGYLNSGTSNPQIHYDSDTHTHIHTHTHTQTHTHTHTHTYQ